MTDKRTHRRIKTAETDEKSPKGQQEDGNEPTKQQYQIAKYLRWHCPTKQTPMEGRGVVVYFTASKAVETLLGSKWATNKGKQEPLFVNRDGAVRYLDDLLKRDFFHRAKKITVKKIGGRDDAGGQQFSETENASPSVSPRAKQSKKKQQQEEQKQLLEQQQAEESGQEGKKERRKKKIKLEWHPVQRFIDGKEAYVWLYEPTSISQIVYGSLIVLGAIGLCLFPLWPPIVRQGVYYVALTAASLIGFLFFLAAFRYVPFTIGWILTAGKLSFWLLPNLTQDVGFFESFVPVYDYEWGKKEGEDDDKNKKKKSDSSSKKDADKSTRSNKTTTSKKSSKDDDAENNDDDDDVDNSAKPADTESEDDEGNAGAVSGEAERETTTDNAQDDADDQTTLRERSSSRQSHTNEKSDISHTGTNANDAEAVSTTTTTNGAEQGSPKPSRVPSGSSQDSSSQEEFEIIERDDKQK